jgi:hypothetical protein
MNNPTNKKTQEIQTLLEAWLSTNQAKSNNIAANNKAIRRYDQKITPVKENVWELRRLRNSIHASKPQATPRTTINPRMETALDKEADLRFIMVPPPAQAELEQKRID